MTALDLSALSPEVTLLGATTIVGPSAAVSSTAVTGFSDVATATVVVKVERVDNSNGEALSVTVQQSDDGNSWTTAAGPYSFTREGTQTLAVDDPADRLRVTYAAARGVREATIGSVTARLGVVDAPGEGYETARVVLSSADILTMASTPIELIPAPDPGYVIVPLYLRSRSGSGTTPYDSSGSVYVRTAMTDSPLTGLGNMLSSNPNPVTNVDIDGSWTFGGGFNPVTPSSVSVTSDSDPENGDFDIAVEIDYIVLAAAVAP